MDAVTASTLMADRVGALDQFETLSHIGIKILGLAFLVRVTMEAAKMIQGGHADWVGCIGKAAFCAILMVNITSLGSVIESASRSLQQTLVHQAAFETFGNAMEATLDAVDCEGSGEWLDLSGSVVKLIVKLGAVFFIVGMYVTKFLVIDIAYPITFGLVLVGGTLSIPMGLFPGIGTTIGWLRNVLEVALWPVIFGIITGILATMFQDTLQDIATSAGSMGCGNLAEVGQVGGAPGQDSLLDDTTDGVFVFVKWITLSIAYCLGVLLVPKFASLIMRSEAVESAGAAIAGRAQVAAGGFTKVRGSQSASKQSAGKRSTKSR